ncbi:ABC transporter-like protein [Lasiodiplodia theobromae]|uniref:ABC transporter-like protein n=1 Tax=Lasiodiplodia theobromae TaxID=45133 RepID=UPI0015C3275E|nr:ABC transporter-like protein [Lasiodiplodia theobromae]KAF4545951.1 ABC transporter-like protein [Lasiodiplodia theobromae]
MRFLSPRARRVSPTILRRYATSAQPPLIRIDNATFYRNHPDSHVASDESPNPPLYPNLNFALPSHSEPNQHWAVLSSSSANRTAFLQILRGQYLSLPPTARSYPYLQTAEIAQKDARLRNPHHAVQYVGFDAERGGLPGGASTKGAYMSARYESMREVTDWSVRDYLLGNTELNADEALALKPPEEMVEQVMRDLNLEALQGMPVSHLSNGQTRRARIAKALLQRPELLLLDGPFMGLDPHSLQYLSGLLQRLADAQQPRLLLSLRPQDFIPEWITNFLVVGHKPKVSVMGDRSQIFEFLRDHYLKTDETDIEFRNAFTQMAEKENGLDIKYTGKHLVDILDRDDTDEMLALYDIARKMESKGDFDQFSKDPEKCEKMRKNLRRPKHTYLEAMTRDGIPFTDNDEPPPLGDPVVQMEGVKIKYNDSSGKTTLLSLITSDHPQTYSAPVKLFGRSRLPTPGEPGISIFEIQSKIGHSSPEVHTYFPKHLTVRRVLESAWADTPISKPRLGYSEDEKVDACLRWFRAELCPDQDDTLDQRAEAYYSARNFPTKDDTAGRYLEITETSLRDEEALLNPSIDWADKVRFGELTFSAQRVALFLRAIIKSPDLVVLDEAFSGMDEMARDKCMLFLNHGETMILRHVHREKPRLRRQGASAHESAMERLRRVRVRGLSPQQALVVVAHARDEVPNCVREYITLPESGTGTKKPLIGRIDGPISVDYRRWGEIWGMPQVSGRPRKVSEEEQLARDALYGPVSPLEVYSKSLNVLTGAMGIPGCAKSAVTRWENARKLMNEEERKADDERIKKRKAPKLKIGRPRVRGVKGEGVEEREEEVEGKADEEEEVEKEVEKEDKKKAVKKAKKTKKTDKKEENAEEKK